MTKNNKFAEYIKQHWEASVMLVFVFLMVFTFVFTPNVRDYDFWFHYRAGEEFIKEGIIPQTAVQSWWGIENDIKWISHEWLFGVLIYLITEATGLFGAAVFSYIVVAIAAVVAFGLNINKWKEYPFVFIIATMVTTFTLKPYAAARPQILLYLLTTALVKLLLDERDNPSKKVFLLIPLTILWTNLHGGSYILIHLFFLLLIISDLFNFEIGKVKFVKANKETIKRRLITFILTIAVIPVNGHGFDMMVYPFSNWFDNTMKAFINEWQPLGIGNFADLLLFLPILTAILLQLCSEKEIKVFDLILAGAFAYLSLSSRRFAGQALFAAILIVPRYIDTVDFTKKILKKDVANVIFPSVAMALIVFFALDFKEVKENPYNLSYFPSDEIVETIKDVDAKRLFNDYNVGGYLTYKHIDVFIDGRADIYSRGNMIDYKKIISITPEIDELVEKYNFDYMLTTKDSSFDYWVQNKEGNNEQFELISEDSGYSLYKNNNFK